MLEWQEKEGAEQEAPSQGKGSDAQGTMPEVPMPAGRVKEEPESTQAELALEAWESARDFVVMSDILRGDVTGLATVASKTEEKAQEEPPLPADRGPAPMDVETPSVGAVASHVVDMEADEEPPSMRTGLEEGPPKSESSEGDQRDSWARDRSPESPSSERNEGRRSPPRAKDADKREEDAHMAESEEPVPQGDVVRKKAQQPEEARVEDKGSGQSCPAESGVPAATFSPPPPWTKGRGDRPESDLRRSKRQREWERNVRSRGVSSDSQSKRGRQESSEQGRSPVRSGERGLRNQPVRLGRTSRSPGQRGRGRGVSPDPPPTVQLRRGKEEKEDRGRGRCPVSFLRGLRSPGLSLVTRGALPRPPRSEVRTLEEGAARSLGRHQLSAKRERDRGPSSMPSMPRDASYVRKRVTSLKTVPIFRWGQPTGSAVTAANLATSRWIVGTRTTWSEPMRCEPRRITDCADLLQH